MPTNEKPKEKLPYHHGNLHAELIEQATQIITKQGVEQLSLRKLAEQIGVSRTAAYHYFKNKNELLCAIAAQGFIQWQTSAHQIFENSNSSTQEKFREFMQVYLSFATENPAMYELMFGGVIWRKNNSTPQLNDVAFPAFKYQVELTKQWQQSRLIDPNEDPLRLAQVLWGSLHGIARLINDGVYQDKKNVTALCDCLVSLFISKNSKFDVKK
jgi:AcrR family transcriptional regulator